MKIDWRKGACVTAGVLAVSMTACGRAHEGVPRVGSSSGSSISCQFMAGTAFVTVKAGGTAVNLANVRVEVYDKAGQPLQGFTPVFKDSGQHAMTRLHARQSVIGYAIAPLNDARSCEAAII